ncbi:MAG: purine-nucleoside phosphorylase, partial [Atopobium sp.]|nr:purine-nucleoside phosphorylase [Atopobium sp.]
GTNPLAEWAGLRDVETPFVDMNDAFSPYLRTLARGVADDLKIELNEGVFAGLLGPNFETPAEVAMLRSFGVSYVGVSTALEVIMARALDMNVLALTLAANPAGAHSC